MNPELIPKFIEVDNPQILSGVAGDVFWEKFEDEIGYFLEVD